MRQALCGIVTLKCPYINPRADFALCVERYKNGGAPCPLGAIFWRLPTHVQCWYIRRMLREFGPETVHAAVGWIGMAMDQQRREQTAKRERWERRYPERVREAYPGSD